MNDKFYFNYLYVNYHYIHTDFIQMTIEMNLSTGSTNNANEIQISPNLKSSAHISKSYTTQQITDIRNRTSILLPKKKINSFSQIRINENCSTIDLSENNIVNFHGMKALPILISLNLDNNNIDSFKDLTSSKAFPKLRWLSIKNNPIIRSPFFRLMCLVCFGSQIITINDVNINEQSRTVADKIRDSLFPELQKGYLLSSFNPIRLVNSANKDSQEIIQPSPELIEAINSTCYTPSPISSNYSYSNLTETQNQKPTLATILSTLNQIPKETLSQYLMDSSNKKSHFFASFRTIKQNLKKIRKRDCDEVLFQSSDDEDSDEIIQEGNLNGDNESSHSNDEHLDMPGENEETTHDICKELPPNLEKNLDEQFANSDMDNSSSDGKINYQDEIANEQLKDHNDDIIKNTSNEPFNQKTEENQSHQNAFEEDRNSNDSFNTEIQNIYEEKTPFNNNITNVNNSDSNSTESSSTNTKHLEDTLKQRNNNDQQSSKSNSSNEFFNERAITRSSDEQDNSKEIEGFELTLKQNTDSNSNSYIKNEATKGADNLSTLNTPDFNHSQENNQTKVIPDDKYLRDDFEIHAITKNQNNARTTNSELLICYGNNILTKTNTQNDNTEHQNNNTQEIEGTNIDFSETPPNNDDVKKETSNNESIIQDGIKNPVYGKIENQNNETIVDRNFNLLDNTSDNSIQEIAAETDDQFKVSDNNNKNHILNDNTSLSDKKSEIEEEDLSENENNNVELNIFQPLNNQEQIHREKIEFQTNDQDAQHSDQKIDIENLPNIEKTELQNNSNDNTEDVEIAKNAEDEEQNIDSNATKVEIENPLNTKSAKLQNDTNDTKEDVEIVQNNEKEEHKIDFIDKEEEIDNPHLKEMEEKQFNCKNTIINWENTINNSNETTELERDFKPVSNDGTTNSQLNLIQFNINDNADSQLISKGNQLCIPQSLPESFDEMMKQIFEKQGNLQKREEEITRKEHELEFKEKNFVEKENTFQQTMKQHQLIMDEREKQVLKNEKEFLEKKKEISEKEESIQQKQTRLKEQEKELNMRSKRSQQFEAKDKKRYYEQCEKERELKSFEKQLKEMENELIQKNLQFQETFQMINQKEQDLLKHEHELQQKLQHNLDIDKEIDRKTEELKSLEDQIKRIEVQLENTEESSSLHNSSNELNENEEVNDKDIDIDELDTSNSVTTKEEKDNEIAEDNQDSNEQDETAKYVNNDNNSETQNEKDNENQYEEKTPKDDITSKARNISAIPKKRKRTLPIFLYPLLIVLFVFQALFIYREFRNSDI